MKIGFVPIDNRPVCYTLPKMIAEIDDDLQLFLPDRELLGDLVKSAKIQNIFEWLENLPQLDALVISLDTLIYGGLIPSRRCNDTLEELRFRINRLENILKSQNTKVFAFSSIMRISNNNINEEEKEYWSKFGKKIFDYSYKTHKYGKVENTDIPKEILEDYLNTRKRNFEINKIFLEWQQEKLFETLVFSKDDCAEYGLNVKEAQELESLGGFVKTGADEIPLALLAKAVSGCMKIAPVFLEPQYKDLISNYEDISVEKSVSGQIELAGCKIVDKKDADIILYINNFKEKQGEIVMGTDTEPYNGNWETPKQPFMIADVRFANGADNSFVAKFKPFDEIFYGYSAWNTTANTLGSLICTAKVKFLAHKYNDDAFKKLQTVRFLDDWAYQANVRKNKPNLTDISEQMKTFENKVSELLKTYYTLNYKYPWNRFFEVEIEFI